MRSYIIINQSQIPHVSGHKSPKDAHLSSRKNRLLTQLQSLSPNQPLNISTLSTHGVSVGASVIGGLLVGLIVGFFVSVLVGEEVGAIVIGAIVGLLVVVIVGEGVSPTGLGVLPTGLGVLPTGLGVLPTGLVVGSDVTEIGVGSGVL